MAEGMTARNGARQRSSTATSWGPWLNADGAKKSLGRRTNQAEAAQRRGLMTMLSRKKRKQTLYS